MQTRLSSAKGFTLIELLTVIGILAVLVTFSVAGLRKASLRAYEVQDIAALRQLGIAYRLMMNEQDEVKANDFFDPSDKLWAYTADSMDQSAAWEDRVAKTAAARKLLSSSYWKKLNAGRYPAGEQFPRSYSVNQWFFPPPPPESGQPNWERTAVRPMRIMGQSQFVLMFMTYTPGTPGIAYMGAANPIYSGINKTGYSGEYGRTPVLFVDGRAVIADLSREYNDDKSWGKEGEQRSLRPAHAVRSRSSRAVPEALEEDGIAQDAGDEAVVRVQVESDAALGVVGQMLGVMAPPSAVIVPNVMVEIAVVHG